MSVQDEKVSKFLLAINKYASEQRETILKEVEEHNKQELDKAEKAVLEESYNLIQSELAQMHSDMQSRLSQKKMQSRCELFEQRTLIEEKVFAKAAEKLAAFVNSGEYLPKLIEDVKRAQSFFSSSESINVYIRPDDMKFSGDIKNALSKDCQVFADEGIKIGGALITDSQGSATADATLDTGLNQQHEWFRENSGLCIC